MTNCLFAEGKKGLTGEMTIRYHQPVAVNHTIRLEAHLTGSHGRLHLIEASLVDNGKTLVSATGKFMERD